MDLKVAVSKARDLIARLRSVERAQTGGFEPGRPAVDGLQAQVVELMRTFAGPHSHFFSAARVLTGADGYRANILVSIAEGFIDHVESGLMTAMSPQRQGQLDVVSDLLGQADDLLTQSGVHPAAPTVLIGASLEEFLRTWIEAEGLSLGERKPSLSSYASLLKEASLLQKQDVKDIESWGGLRNHAAHGEWDEVDDRKRVRLMLEGVNHFLRMHAPGPAAT